MQKLILESNNAEMIVKVKDYAALLGLTVEVRDEGAQVLPFVTESKSNKTIAQMECDVIEKALKDHRGNYSQTAKSLGIGRATLYRKAKEYGLFQKSVAAQKVS